MKNSIIRRPDFAGGGITEDERAALARHAETWIARALRTDPIVPELIVPAIEDLYAAAGLDKPRVVIVPSPLAMAVTYGLAAAIWHLRDRSAATDVATNAATRDATLTATRNATLAATDAATDTATLVATDIATLVATDVATRDATLYATFDATRHATFDATRHATLYATRHAMFIATDAATRYATLVATDVATDAATRDATLTATRNATLAATDAATDTATRGGATRYTTNVPTGDATRGATNAATRDATLVATLEVTRGATNDATDAATRNATRHATDAATDAATFNATRYAPLVAALDATDAATSVTTRYATDESRWIVELAKLFGGEDYRFFLSCVERWDTCYHGGNMWAHIDCYLTATRDVLGLRLPVHAEYDAWERAAIHGGFRCLHEKFCVVSDFPEVLRMDVENRPHCETGPSHRWRDGWALYHWHGVRVPGEWIEDRSTLTPAIALAQQNVEVRRAACEILGWGRVLAELDAKTIDRDPDPEIGELVEVTLPKAGRERFLNVRCGTGRRFTLPVPPTMRTALEANAWTYGLSPDEYHPEVRT